MLYERSRVAVGDLESHSKEHGEYEECRHVPVPEELECIKAESLRESLLLAAALLARTVRKSEAVDEHDKAKDS